MFLVPITKVVVRLGSSILGDDYVILASSAPTTPDNWRPWVLHVCSRDLRLEINPMTLVNVRPMRARVPPEAPTLANAQPIDEAPHFALDEGLTARCGLCNPGVLQLNPKSHRVHSKAQIKKIARSIEVSGNLDPVIADERWVILSGHGRLEAVRHLGRSSIPVLQIFGLSDAKKLAFLHADNRIAEDARWDREALAIDLPEMKALLAEADIDLTDLGFEVLELDQLAADFSDRDGDPDDEIDEAILNAPPVLQLGDLMVLGGHRLSVDDARDAAALDRLCGDDRVSAAFLDPPYNLSVCDIGGRGRVSHPEFAHASGEMTPAEFIAFLIAATGNAARVSRPGAVHFVCMDWRHIRELLEAAETVYDAYLNLVVWNKTSAGQGSPYRSQHELIGVFRVGDEPHRDNVQKGRFGRNRTNVWTYPGANTFGSSRLKDLADHPTVKPTRLVAEALKDCTRRGETVLDTFVGSGTTILAAEMTGRCARAMEIEPRYADVAVRRWQALSGRDAIHTESGLSFNELQQRRATPPQAASPPRARTRTRSP